MSSGLLCKALIITGYAAFKEGETEKLWKQGVDLDDWDYMILIDDPEAKLLDSDVKRNYDGTTEREYYPDDWQLQRLLQGCCSNTWYPKIKFRGKTYSLGVAYHS